MSTDMLTQLQKAVDDLSLQFVAVLHFVNQRHDLEILGPKDSIKDTKTELDQRQIDALPSYEFRSGMLELAQDLVVKEQQIELLISLLPGLESTEIDQERCIHELEEEVRIAEAQRLEAVKEKREIMKTLSTALRAASRP
jgi:mediator of RNA polymerase II transcription subunit 21